MNASLLMLFVGLAAVNGSGLFCMGQDKALARKGVTGKERTPEGLLFFLAIIGGSLGIYAGMLLFRHKTQKLYFSIGLPLLLLQQGMLLFLLFQQ